MNRNVLSCRAQQRNLSYRTIRYELVNQSLRVSFVVRHMSFHMVLSFENNKQFIYCDLYSEKGAIRCIIRIEFNTSVLPFFFFLCTPFWKSTVL